MDGGDMTIWIPRPMPAALRTRELFERSGIGTHVDPVIKHVYLPVKCPTVALYDAINISGID
jgi:hypothetical protein